MRLRTPIALAALAATVTLAACGSSSGSGSSSTAAAVVTTVTTATPATSAKGATAAKTVNANTATESDIAAVLTSNGVPSAARWAKEIVEYRPYPADDANWTRLRDNLAKYNPDPAVLDKIVASLTAA